MEGCRVSTTGRVLWMSKKTSPKGNVNVANPSSGKEGCTEWSLKVPFNSAIVLMWLLTFMYSGFNPILNCFWVKILDLFGNKSTLEVGLKFS